MASVGQLSNRGRVLFRSFRGSVRNYTQWRGAKQLPKDSGKCAVLVAGGLVAFSIVNYTNSKPHQALNVKKIKEEEKAIRLTARERRFIKFASVEYDGQLYMTPQDFLDSVVEQEPRPRLKRRTLTANDINQIKDVTPPLKKGSPDMFRKLRDKGIISYTEYLFLLSVLTKPQSGFRIAFNMFDTDGNHRVDKNEFLVMEKIFSGAWKDKHGVTESSGEDEYVDDEEGLQRRHKVDTTLQVHFFGKKGNQDLYYEGFHKFMYNLQTEVLELEFSEFSKGNTAITEVDFAKILLRYTYLDTDEYDMYLDRLLDRVKDEQGITFVEFRDFCQFLNNLEDFAIAMRMYTLADRAISKDEFSRAVKICTGYTLTKHLIDTVFAIFDEDGDGLLSYKEFIAIMKDRLHRGFKSTAKSEGWDAFKYCLKQEMKQSNSL
ncbi:calcium uptake protein 3, mitochondrial isoform X3 [Hermetia illucens]|uniref:calcium uptake protein 3, mitochondrial isoform X3 n=1 Tax=Hermetia illucens TaxID=343691 RepID=UPI0018CBFB13|nr:calcium uptake protein 3, mitochondrial isoform X3 [Hermetia illucens]